VRPERRVRPRRRCLLGRRHGSRHRHPHPPPVGGPMPADTSLTDIPSWDPAARTLTTSGTWYEVTVLADAGSVAVLNNAAGTVHYRATYPASDSTEDAWPIPSTGYLD